MKQKNIAAGKSRYWVAYSLLLPFFQFNSHAQNEHAAVKQRTSAPVEVRGLVLDACTKKPLSNVHVYAQKGEEEAFTDNNGGFKFSTWKQLPFELTVQQTGGGEKKVKVVSAPVKLTVLFP